jgi:hypothetical protein
LEYTTFQGPLCLACFLHSLADAAQLGSCKIFVLRYCCIMILTKLNSEHPCIPSTLAACSRLFALQLLGTSECLLLQVHVLGRIKDTSRNTKAPRQAETKHTTLFLSVNRAFERQLRNKLAITRK